MKLTYFVYLDEFGHVGPFISRDHAQHNTFPVFGFGGLIIPADEVRSFSAWFYNLKCSLLAFEIKRAGIAAFRWEKKGASLYTSQNVLRYAELRRATFRLFNKIERSGSHAFYVGIEKTLGPDIHQPNRMMFAILREAIKRLDQFCLERDAAFIVFLDHRSEEALREAVVSVIQQEMYGANPKRTLLEAPTQVESHLYQLMQGADWLCGLLGRVESYRVRPDEYSDYNWTTKYFTRRLDLVSIRSGVRKQTNLMAMPFGEHEPGMVG